MPPGSVLPSVSPGLSGWLRAHDVSLLVSAPAADRVLSISAGEGEAVGVGVHGMPRPMGLAVAGGTLFIACALGVWRFEHAGRRGWLPRAQLITGDLDVHDLALEPGRGLAMAVTAYDCVGRLSESASFEPSWRPPFVTELVAEDRCHLNGLGCDDEGLRYVSMFARSDAAQGWRLRTGDGVVYDTCSGSVVVGELVMPHSPRSHLGCLWVLEAGSGTLLRVEPGGSVQRLVQLPGFVRGMSFVGGHPLVTLSRPRRVGAFLGLPLGMFAEPARCGVRVLSPDGRTVEHVLDLPAPFDELYDVVALPGTAASFAGVSTDAARRTVVLA
ncbi:TIGR03032 family protein [Enhygromyxa salina]|uniref:Conserved hypothetical protein CHP03032 domain-containing protein n=1 Tax=Enhygromyxa salina TaxID=215803 RepID=A0A2S9YSK7_9BACT|nr:TIGR03032 family protein [Enhygromyxa salina]PRQ08078.1 hypothetical protein ENSA7_22320 [Enhygromyxa salina]